MEAGALVKGFTLFTNPHGTERRASFIGTGDFKRDERYESLKKKPVRYAINQILKKKKGPVSCSDIVESWWEDRQGMVGGRDDLEAMIFDSALFPSRQGEEGTAFDTFRYDAWEYVVVPPPNINSSIKYVGFYTLPENTEPETFWRYHTVEHAAHSVDSFGPYLKGYVINRVWEGSAAAPDCFGIVELWFDDYDSMIKGFKAHESVILENGRNVSEDFNVRVVGAFGYETESFCLPG